MNNNGNKKRYLNLLALQYSMALGIKAMDTKSKSFEKDMINWIYERQAIGKKYVDFLNYLGLDVTTRETAEIGKGKFDTIVKDYDTTIITPYEYMDNNSDRLFKYEFFPTKDIPGLIKTSIEGRIDEIVSAPDYLKKFVTQNPYERTDLMGFEELHNGNNFDIIVGMYGHIHDNDKEMKLKQLKELRDKLTSDDYAVDYEVDRDSYLATIYSDRKQLEKIKVKR